MKHYKGGRLLDAGCLDSLASPLAKEKYPKSEVWGIDTARGAILDMQERFPNVYYQVGDVYNTKFPDNYFAYIIAGELIEHLDDPQKFFKEAFRILKRGGILAVSTPLGETEEGEVDHLNHLWSFEEEDLIGLLEPYGKVWTRQMGSEFFPIYKYHFPTLLAFCSKK